MFHKRLRSLVLQSFDLSYGGEVGFDQAIDMSAAVIGSTKLKQEKELLDRYMTELSRGSNMYCVSIKDTLEALEMGAVDDLIVSESLAVNRCVMRDPTTEEESVEYISGMEEDTKKGDDRPMEIVEEEPLLDWLRDNYQSFGSRLTLVSDRTAAGRSFAQGLGGLGGLLRWSVDFHDFDTDADCEDVDCEEGWCESSNEEGTADGDFGF
eukprot:Sro710_g191050.2  (209) ;mRNA; f:21557-22183